MRLVFTESAWQDYRWLQDRDRVLLKRINLLIKDTLRTPVEGIGKPERFASSPRVDMIRQPGDVDKPMAALHRCERGRRAYGRPRAKTTTDCFRSRSRRSNCPAVRRNRLPPDHSDHSAIRDCACVPPQMCYHACMSSQLTLRGVPDEVRRRLSHLSQTTGESLNTTIRRILERAVGADGRRQRLAEYATWNEADLADFERALAEQRTIDADLWR